MKPSSQEKFDKQRLREILATGCYRHITTQERENALSFLSTLAMSEYKKRQLREIIDSALTGTLEISQLELAQSILDDHIRF
ncbi:MAG TPA: hypothetical protein VK255_00205 [Patescibacteria group bacterium]|nr:hypothetical protein [Patescibacteria group bacterium]